MANIEYHGELDIFAEYLVPGKAEPKIEVLLYFVDAFGDGGATGKVDLRSTDEQAIRAEFERIRAHKSVTLYLRINNNLSPTVKLIELSKSNVKSFTTVFRVKVYDKKNQKILSVTYARAEGSFLEKPISVGKTESMLKIKLSLPDLQLVTRAGDEISALNFRKIPRGLGATFQI